MSEENKAVVRGAFEVANSGNLAALSEYYADNVKYHGAMGMELEGLEALKAFIGTFVAAFSNMHINIEGMLSEGDLVAAHVTAGGTHTGDLEGLAPTGKQVSGVRGLTICRISGGKVVEEWEVIDQLGLMQQLGAMPS